MSEDFDDHVTTVAVFRGDMAVLKEEQQRQSVQAGRLLPMAEVMHGLIGRLGAAS